VFKKIVVALDGSECTKRVLEAAIVLAKGQGAELHLLHVVKEVHTRYTAGERALSITELNKALYKEGEEVLKSADSHAQGEGITPHTTLAEGDPAEEIIQFAQQNQMDLIVVGSRGRGSLKEMMLGSVSHKVSHLAEYPVLIVK
jgi:nucleotide-binding universal stress UspA family protein